MQVKEAARLWGFDQLKSRLEALMGWGLLPDKCRAAARGALQVQQTPRICNILVERASKLAFIMCHLRGCADCITLAISMIDWLRDVYVCMKENSCVLLAY